MTQKQSGRGAKPSRSLRSRVQSTILIAVVGLAAAAGWFLRDCVGLGPGGGSEQVVRSEQQADAASTAASDAIAPVPADAQPLRPCKLFLDADGLTVDDQPGSVADAVVRCRPSGKAQLRATGAARAGSYDQLRRALDRAGITVERY